VNASLVLIVLGSILNFSKPSGYGATAADLHHLTDPEAVFPRTAEWICSGLRHLDGQAIIVLGLATLIATPVMRVAVSILAFVYQRDRIFALITSTVLALLILSFLLGKAAGLRMGPPPSGQVHASPR
jgi:uncharacterized membrane protein